MVGHLFELLQYLLLSISAGIEW